MSAHLHFWGLSTNQTLWYEIQIIWNKYSKPCRTPPLWEGWGVVSPKKVVGPYFFGNQKVTRKMYKNIFSYCAFQRRRENPRDMKFPRDGAPAHNLTMVRQFLNQKLPNCWQGRDGADSLPPCSPGFEGWQLLQMGMSERDCVLQLSAQNTMTKG